MFQMSERDKNRIRKEAQDGNAYSQRIVDYHLNCSSACYGNSIIARNCERRRGIRYPADSKTIAECKKIIPQVVNEF